MGQPLFDHSPNLTAERHIRGAKNNLAFGDALKASGQNDPTTVGWAITALFYSAVHTVRAYLLARHKVVVSSHEDVRSFESKYPELKRTSPSYRHLKQQSEKARYYLFERFTWDDYIDLRVDAQRVLSTWEAKVGTASEKK